MGLLGVDPSIFVDVSYACIALFIVNKILFCALRDRESPLIYLIIFLEIATFGTCIFILVVGILGNQEVDYSGEDDGDVAGYCGEMPSSSFGLSCKDLFMVYMQLAFTGGGLLVLYCCQCFAGIAGGGDSP